jgi:DNA-binding CsgD family transcriptional regulator/putative methionine-R-sulfoxide reductase with GAF domain
MACDSELAGSFSVIADELHRRMSMADSSTAHARGDVHLDKLLDALDELRRLPSVTEIFDQAPRLLCETGMFARVMVSRVQGSTWSPISLFCRNEQGRATLQIDGVVEDLHIALASPLVEAEVVRRRLPALVGDAQNEQRVHRPLVSRTATREYVVAPIVADSSVVGLLHADDSDRASDLTELERDLLRLYADGVGLSIECAELHDRAELQQRILAEACAATSESLTTLQKLPELQFTAIGATSPVRPPTAIARTRTDDHRDSTRLARLTTREREVLEFLASGATNAQLADRLTVAESTVKSHVKHILHKLGAANRAAAISCYLREARADDRRMR